jgi:protein gp37
VSFFFKQWGGANKKKAGRIEGCTWTETPGGAVAAGQVALAVDGAV